MNGFLEETQIKMREVLEDFSKEMAKLGIDTVDSTNENADVWDVYEQKLYENADFNLDHYLIYLGNSATEEDHKNITKIKEYAEYTIQIKGTKKVVFKFDFNPYGQLVNIFFLLEETTGSFENPIAWKDFYQSWGFEEYIEEIELKKAFNKKAADKKMNEVDKKIIKKYLSYIYEFKKRLREEVVLKLEEAQERMDELRQKSKRGNENADLFI